MRKMAKNSPPQIGRLVTIQKITESAYRDITVRVQDHLSVQYTYSLPDNDTVIGIHMNSEAWKYDTEGEAYWDEPTTQDSVVESGGEAGRDSWKDQRAGRRVPRKNGTRSGDAA